MAAGQRSTSTRELPRRLRSSQMTVPPPKYLFLLTVSGTLKRIHLMAFQAIVITFGLWLYSGAGQFATAQDIFGRIAGTITDSSGGAVPNAQGSILHKA